MLEGNHDTTHRDVKAPLRRFPPEYTGPVRGRSTLRSNRSSGGTVVVAVNNSLLRPGGNTRPFRAVMRFCRSLFSAFGPCCAIAGPVSANSISGQASVIDGDTIEIRGERIRLVSIDAPESRHTCLDAGGRALRYGQRAALALSTPTTEQVQCLAADLLVERGYCLGPNAGNGRMLIRVSCSDTW